MRSLDRHIIVIVLLYANFSYSLILTVAETQNDRINSILVCIAQHYHICTVQRDFLLIIWTSKIMI